jgi:hypothetical protein
MALHSSSYDSLYDERPEPPKPRDSSGVYVILLVVAAALIVALVIPSVRARISKFFPSATSKKVAMGAQVWANQQEGSYFCANSRRFGRGAGRYMRQGDALTLGYQPALGQYCGDGQTVHSSDVSKERGRLTQPRGNESGSSVQTAAGRR